MKMSEEMKNMLIEMYEEKYKHNKYILNMDGRHIHYDKEELEELEKQNEEIRKILESLRAE